MSYETEQDRVIDRHEAVGVIDRREAIRRVTALLGGIALVGGSGLLAACEKERPISGTRVGPFTSDEVAFLDEVADTILPETKTPGAKAARTGPFMALMVTDTYDANQQKAFREGMQKIEDATQKAYGVSFMKATPQQRLAVLEPLDREQKAESDAKEAARKEKLQKQLAAIAPAATPTTEPKKADAFLPDERKENAVGTGENTGALAITAEKPPHYFRMMKELALLGYFTSEIGYTKAMRYVESPGKFEPCVPYTKGEPAWAPHA
jgi:glucoside 3-dehydrogenase (cytochrome c) hitch-hiker subunit